MVDPIPELSFIPTLLRESVSPPLSSSSPATSHSSFRAATTVVHSAVRELHSRQVSVSSNQSVEMSAMPVTSWAMAAKKGAAVKAPPQSSIKERELSADGIRRNRKGQRIDPPTPEFKKDEVNRLKKLKLCNAHHLRHNCPYPDGKCEHDHLYKCNAKELETLKLVARMSACIHGINMVSLKLSAFALFALKAISAYAQAPEIVDEIEDPDVQQTPKLNVAVSVSFPDSEVFGVKLVNGHATNAILSIANHETTPVHLRFVGGSLVGPKTISNLTLSKYDLLVPAGEQE
ncbi:hypothetical protein KCU59_g19332, partial [Aureobasidium melanogenum]